MLGSEPYKKVKENPEISSPRAIIRLEGLTPSPLESTMKLLTESLQKTDSLKNTSEKEKTPVDNFENRNKSENKTLNGQDHRSSSKTMRKAPESSVKQHYQQQNKYQVFNNTPRQQHLPPELKSERVYSALIRSTPHIKLNGSLYDNHIILVLPSSLFGK